MIVVKATVDAQQTSDFLKRLQNELIIEKADQAVEIAALRTQTQAVIDTKTAIMDYAKKERWNIAKPEDYWYATKAAMAVWWVENRNKVMIWLDRGTRGHGPLVKKFLYVPLTRRAAGGWYEGLKFGLDYILTKWVRGTRPYNVSEPLGAKAREILLEEMKAFVRRAINRAKATNG